MLKNLIKYDYRDQGKLLWPLHLALLLGSLLAGLCLQYYIGSLHKLAMNPTGTNVINFMQIVSMAVVVLFLTAIMASSIVTLVLIGRQYYRNCFCDEGYLTFTLPVTPSQVLLSKLITGTIWVMTNLIAIMLCGALFLLLGLAGVPEVAEAVPKFVTETLNLFREAGIPINIPWWIVKYGLMYILSAASGVAMLHFVITMGNQIAKKHKILCAVALYFLLNFALSTLGGIIGSVMTLRMATMQEFEAQIFLRVYNISILVGVCFSVAVGGLLFYFTDRTLNNKLNLE